MQELLKRGIIPVATVCGVLEFGCPRVFAVEGVVDARYGVIGQSILLLRNTWPKVLQVLRIFKEQGLVLAVLLGLSAFFFMAETSITTLWAWEGIAFKLAKKKKGMMIGFVSFEDEELKSSSKNFEGKTTKR
ncbi:hypothetical protein VIGAN_07086100 [Vigna angularis var. angularis]|uniref:CNNM transmembrane domain-containing protein n=1 Tax=Vigna angularis var. angularis TaxID=157739 RepID=A0A0S3SH31_PHAAN|nr:putative DUF21 domain-containing protein At3g13070, chloroplastic [Vigna angularis]BAT92182.1 hypothetical protein VIGAN_07086100 [Vigna angularis var. angularis]